MELGGGERLEKIAPVRAELAELAKASEASTENFGPVHSTETAHFTARESALSTWIPSRVATPTSLAKGHLRRQTSRPRRGVSGAQRSATGMDP